MAQQTISAVFGGDHDRLDALFTSFQELKRSDLEEAKRIFSDFKRGLERHIVWEQELLFPLWEEKTGMTEGGPTEVMRMEHRRIEECLRAIDRKLEAHDPDSDAEEHALLELLGSHNVKEERVLYPAIDQKTSEAERASVYRAMKEIER